MAKSPILFESRIITSLPSFILIVGTYFHHTEWHPGTGMQSSSGNGQCQSSYQRNQNKKQVFVQNVLQYRSRSLGRLTRSHTYFLWLAFTVGIGTSNWYLPVSSVSLNIWLPSKRTLITASLLNALRQPIKVENVRFLR